MVKTKGNLRKQLRESIDPRFCGVFNSTKTNNIEEKNSSLPLDNIKCEYKQPKINENVGFQNFISTKLAEYLDKHIKEVDKPVLENDFFSNKLKSIQLFSGSDAITEEESVKLVQKKPKKKKHRKHRYSENEVKESFKEVAVTFDWLQQQAKILTS